MNEIFSKDIEVLLSQCDHRGRLGVSQTFDLFMDLAGEHAAILGNGVPEMTARGLFWVAVKTRVRLCRAPAVGERCTALTWPETPGRMRCERDYLLRAGEEILAAGKTEWTILDTVRGGLHAMRDGIYAPDQTYAQETALEGPFHRFLGGFEGKPFADYRVRSTDVDLVGHMNNVAYVRMLLGLFSTTERDAHPLRELEVHYRNACHEGDRLLLRRRAGDRGEEFQAALEDGTLILLARAEHE